MEEKRNSSKMLKSLISVSGIVLLAKLLGFIKQMVTANAFGATIQTDIISLSEGLVSNLDYLLVQALATAFIPTYIHANSEDKESSKRFVSNTITVFFVISFIITLILLLAAPLISRILAPSYSVEQSVWLTKYLRIVAPSLIIIVELAVFNSLLKANEVFAPGELINLNQSVILILLVILFGSRFGPDTLVIGFFAYAVYNLLYLLFCSRKQWTIEKGNPFADPNVRKLLLMMGPLLLGYAMVFINQQVDKIIVSGLGEGTVTTMTYAAVLSNFVTSFVGSICGVLFTYVTQNIAEKRDEDAAELTMTSTVRIATLLLPISLITITCSGDIVTIVFGRGRFDAAAVKSCSLALIGYGCMFIPYVVRELFSRFQYAYGDSKKPMINSTISIVFNIAFSVILSRFIGVLGVTLATSLSVLICAILNIASSKKKNDGIKMASFAKHLPRWLLGGTTCLAIELLGLRMLTNMGTFFRLAVITAVSLIVYGIITFPILKALFESLIRKKSR